MSVTVAKAEPSIAGVGDYIELMKPRVMSLVVFTALVGLVLALVPMHPVMAFTALLCIAVGAGAAGALPPVIGRVAATGTVAVEPLLLFLIVFLWTPPHFWALSLYRAEDYARAGVPMLPVVAGAAETRRQNLRYTLILVPVGLAPWLLGYAGALYGIAAALAGAAMFALAIRVRGETRGHRASK